MNMICRCGPRRTTHLMASDAAPRARSKGNDPTGTLPLQRRFEKEMNRRWDGLRRVVPSLVNQRTDAASTIEHAAITGHDPVRAFQTVFDKALKMMVVGPARGWMLTYVRGAGDIAIARATDHVQTLAKDAEWDDASLILDASPQRDRIPPLQTLAHSELQGIAEAVSQQAVRAFTNGLLNRGTPASIARDIQSVIDKVGKGRSSLLVSFIVVRAFSAVTLDAFRAAGVGSVGIKPESAPNKPLTTDAKPKKKTKPKNLVEVLTAGDDDVCPVCEQISEEGPYTLDEAEMLIPAHPRCRCAFVPWNDKRFASVHDDKDALGHGSFPHKLGHQIGHHLGHHIHHKIRHIFKGEHSHEEAHNELESAGYEHESTTAHSTGGSVAHSGLRPPSTFGNRYTVSHYSHPKGHRATVHTTSGEGDKSETTVEVKRAIAQELKREIEQIKKLRHDSVTHTASGIMFMDQNGRVLFVRRSDNSDHPGEWCFPGGAIEPGETAEQAARREAQEEVGYDYTNTLEQIDRRELSGVDFTTFLAEVQDPFDPVLDAEHTDAVWRRLDNPPEPLHPGVRATIDAAVVGDEFTEALHPRDKDGKFATKAEASTSEIKSGALDFGSLKKVGEQKGSNTGGVYQDPSGSRYYIKTMDESHAKNERLAASLYALTGAPTLEYVDVAPQGDKHFVATKFEKLEKDNVSQFTPVERKFAQKNFATHAWLANWDAAGTGGDNQGFHDNQIKTLDVGGSLEYRAKGASKGAAFGTSVDEFYTLRDPKKNKDAANLFGDMTNDQIKQSAEKVVSIPDHVVKDTVLKNGGTLALADKLIARKNDLSMKVAALGHPELEKAVNATSGAGSSPAVTNTATPSTVKTPHDYIKSVKGTSAERIEWRKQLKSATDPAQKLELKNKILASFKKQHDSTGNVSKKSEIAANLAKYSKMYKVPNPLTTAAVPVAAVTVAKTIPTTTTPAFGKAEPKPIAPQSSSYTPTADDLPSKYASFTPQEKQGFDDLVRLVNGSTNGPLNKYHYKEASNYVDWATKRLTNMKYYGTDGGLTAVEAAHIVAYSGSQYRETNSALRAGKMTEAVYKHTEALDGALSKLPGYVGTVYRKANLSSAQAAKYEPGHVVVEHAFTSTSKKEGVWSGAYRYVIEARGKRGHDIEKLSSHGSSEAEVLYQSGSKFLVTKREGNKIYMREL